MSPTPVTFTSADGARRRTAGRRPNEAVAERYGIPVESIVRFDLNTSPTPPDLAGRLLAAGRFETPLSEYPPSDYRRLVDAAAARYGVDPSELLVGAGADEILDLVGKAFLPPAARPSSPSPTYAMYRVITEQRGARVRRRPRLGPDAGWALDVAAIRAAAIAERPRSCGCAARTTRPRSPEPDGADRHAARRPCADAARPRRRAARPAAHRRPRRGLRRVRRPIPARPPARRTRALVVVRTASKAYALAGLRVGLRDRAPRRHRDDQPLSAAGIRLDRVGHARDRGPARSDAILAANLERVDARARAPRGPASSRPAGRPGRRSRTSCSSTSGRAERAAAAAEGLLRRGLVPRTFPAGHPLAAFLRLTVRDRGRGRPAARRRPGDRDRSASA